MKISRYISPWGGSEIWLSAGNIEFVMSLPASEYRKTSSKDCWDGKYILFSANYGVKRIE